MSFIDLDGYIKLIKKANNIILVKDYKNYQSGLILRHDVDVSIDLAYELYQLEKSNNIKSTYYILLTSNLYNPFSLKNKKRLREMTENGFEVGLHFDPSVYDNSENLEIKFKKEVESFEKFLNLKLYSYSMHNPSLNSKYIENSSLIDAYNKEIFCNECYISDSSFNFKGKDINKYIEKSKYKLIQLLIHPNQLFSNGCISYKTSIKKLVYNYIQEIDTTYSVNNVYRNERKAILNDFKCIK